MQQMLPFTQYKDNVQYRHLIPAPVERTSPSVRLYKQPLITCQKCKPSASMAHVAY